MTLHIESAAGTHIGLVRKTNQDCFGIDPSFGLYLVCDGMGGAAGGEIASSLAVDTFLAIARQELQSGTAPALSLHRAVGASNRAVVARAQWDTAYRGMGSTLVAAQLAGDSLTLINVGDSRAYLVRDGQITQLTNDHSVVAERVRAGLITPAEAEGSPMQSIITRAIGAELDVLPDLFEAQLQPGDIVLLASDGLTRHVPSADLIAALSYAPRHACDRLIALANERGGRDNITCLVLAVTA